MSLTSIPQPSKRKRLLYGTSAFALLFLVGLGVFARQGWLPSTDPLSGKRTGWFGKELPKNAASSWNPLAMPSATPTPQLSKEYITRDLGFWQSRMRMLRWFHRQISPCGDPMGPATVSGMYLAGRDRLGPAIHGVLALIFQCRVIMTVTARPTSPSSVSQILFGTSFTVQTGRCITDLGAEQVISRLLQTMTATANRISLFGGHRIVRGTSF